MGSAAEREWFGGATVETLWEASIETPIGPLVAIASERGLCELEFHREERLRLYAARLRRWYGGAVPGRGTNPHLSETRIWLRRYFAAQFEDLAPLTLDTRGTVFELSVWRAMREIRLGEVSTYAALASRVGVERGARAVGAASRRNPVCIVTPCHRVIGSGGSLVGYGGGLDLKRRLLEHEGAVPSLAAPASGRVR